MISTYVIVVRHEPVAIAQIDQDISLSSVIDAYCQQFKTKRSETTARRINFYQIHSNEGNLTFHKP